MQEITVYLHIYLAGLQVWWARTGVPLHKGGPRWSQGLPVMDKGSQERRHPGKCRVALHTLVTLADRSCTVQ